MWRWDQGRLQYFSYDVLKKLAGVLVQFDGVDVSNCEEVFRSALVGATGMPFSPSHYTIKRNYARVFQSAFLACFRKNTLVVSDVCRELAKEDGMFPTADDYFLFYMTRFRFPFPAFDGYNISEPRSYPFCAIVKFLISRKTEGSEANVSVDEVFDYLIENECIGLEPLEYYQRLLPGISKEKKIADRRRQVREMMLVISQLSFLKMKDGILWLDITDEQVEKELLEKVLMPGIRPAETDTIEEFLKMTACDPKIQIPQLAVLSIPEETLKFVEGNRKREEHFRIERSGLLRKYYRETHPEAICSACKQKMKEKYPWTDYMLDIHHLRPLSSAVAISTKGTSLDDLVGLCPSCHRAVHLYYNKWLKERNQSDFTTKMEAREVYLKAAGEIAS